MAVADLPTYGYRRVWALLRRESERDGLPVVNAKRVYRIMRTHNLLLERKPADPCRKRAHKGRVAVAESNRGVGSRVGSLLTHCFYRPESLPTL